MRNGDATALADCYRAHAQHLRTVALRFSGDLADAEDVVHDVFMHLPASLAHYEERGQLRAWLTRLTIHESLTHRRRERVRAASPLADVHDMAAPTVNGDPIAAARVMRALIALSPALRHVFVLRAIHDCSHAEIGELLGISTNTSEVRLHRAVRQLRDFLESIR
jgi:RNA polymerase sigma-70 factor (ECF subfamily)